MSQTPHLGLELTAENDNTTIFKNWRISMNGESNSNMTKIDEAFGEMDEHCDEMQSKLDTVSQKVFGESPMTWADVQTIVRNGAAPQYFDIGDQISCYRATSAAAVVTGTGITAATVDVNTFVNAMNKSDPVSYELSFDGTNWKYNGDTVTLANYGITPTGTAVSGDKITVTVTATEITWDVVSFNNSVLRAWTFNGDTYYTHFETPVANDLVYAYTNNAFVLYGIVTTVGTTITITPFGGSATAGYPRNSEADTAYGTHGYSMELQTHDCINYGTTQFDNFEANYHITTQIASGTVCKIALRWYADSTTQNGVFYFTAPADLVVGGQFRYTGGANMTYYESASAASGTTIALTDVDPGESTDIATSLSHKNHEHRVSYGSNNWYESSERQWLNSDEAGNSWWEPTNDFDRPATNVASAGFIYGLDPEFVDVVTAAVRPFNLNNVTITDDSTNYYDEDDSGVTAAATRIGARVTLDKFTLPSFTEYYMGTRPVVIAGSSKDIRLGAPFEYYSRMNPSPTTGALSGRIKYYTGTARRWFGRSARPSDASFVYVVLTDGSGGSYGASSAFGCAPACAII
jgi:hypothetical protein